MFKKRVLISIGENFWMRTMIGRSLALKTSLLSIRHFINSGIMSNSLLYLRVKPLIMSSVAAFLYLSTILLYFAKISNASLVLFKCLSAKPALLHLPKSLKSPFSYRIFVITSNVSMGTFVSVSSPQINLLSFGATASLKCFDFLNEIKLLT